MGTLGRLRRDAEQLTERCDRLEARLDAVEAELASRPQPARKAAPAAKATAKPAS